MSFLGNRLRTARLRKQLLQVQVYEKTGINNKTLSRYESGGSEPDVETLKVLAELYGTSIDWLTGHTDNPFPSENAKIQEEQTSYLIDLLNDSELSTEDKEMIKLIKELPADKKRLVKELLAAFGKEIDK
ncbi:helix-turn-helix domain-containing protein [Brevibacillus sp. HB2.2]|uniref:helix-turn-helix domain-containing protein n=1 Tax=Brevibacillus sp. HB2.2 TaxID=2738846 RepID=UPI00156BD82C|nr:helix-turn-helix domain-containing protein [Brevibacillus sp. HB2.2]NRS51945.1 helix-turn-helix domain-containing protein [Brevibacillus sp. HB2.2]